MAPRTVSVRVQALELADAMDCNRGDLPELVQLLEAHERRGCHDCGHEVLWHVAAELAGHTRLPLRPVRRAVITVLADRLAHPVPTGGFPR